MPTMRPRRGGTIYMPTTRPRRGGTIYMPTTRPRERRIIYMPTTRPRGGNTIYMPTTSPREGAIYYETEFRLSGLESRGRLLPRLTTTIVPDTNQQLIAPRAETPSNKHSLPFYIKDIDHRPLILSRCTILLTLIGRALLVLSGHPRQPTTQFISVQKSSSLFAFPK